MSSRTRKLSDQVWVITGGSSGIGRTTARMAAERGARVVLASRDAEDLREAVKEIQDAGGEATFVVCDVADMEAVQGVAETALRTYGRIDTWFNNAGVSVYGRVVDVPVEDARRVFDTNYWGVVNGSLVAIQHLHEEGGVLLNMGSLASQRSLPLQGHYAATKQAVRAFTSALRMELEHDDVPISVTLIEPGAIDTPYPQHARSYLPREPKHPPPVYGPEPVARAVLHCAENPRREILIGGAARALVAMGRHMPRMTDRYMEATMFEGQMRDNGSPHGRTDSLYSPHPGDAAERGDQPGRIRRTSAYTQAALHPLISLGSAAAVLAIAATGTFLARR